MTYLANLSNKTVRYAPQITQKDDFLCVLRQAEWYLPLNADGIEVILPVSAALAREIATDGAISISNAITLSAAKTFPAANKIMFWQRSAKFAATPDMRRKAVPADEYADPACGDIISAVFGRADQNRIDADAKQFAALCSDVRGQVRPVLMIGSGPHETADLHLKSDGSSVNIFLSTAIFMDDLCRQFAPDIIVANDGPSQFDYGKTAQAFQIRVLELMELYPKLRMIVPDIYYNIIARQWPQSCLSRILFIPLTRDAAALPERFDVKWEMCPTRNVLTALGLPAARGLSDDIIFYGITLPETQAEMAIKPSAPRRHWGHRHNIKYQQHVADMIWRHPASVIVEGNYMDAHMGLLSYILARHNDDGGTLSIWPNRPVYSDLENLEDESMRLGAPPLKQAVFNGLVWAENRPVFAAAGSAVICGLLYFIVEKIMSEFWPALAFGALIFLFVMTYFMFRLRMSRMTAQMETRLSKQQATQFKNLSDRLESLEEKNGPL